MERVNNIIKKKFKGMAYEFGRKNYLRKVVSDVGRIVEKEDKVECYASQNIVDMNYKNSGSYKLTLHGLNSSSRKVKENIEYYKLNKEVYYIFNNIYFDRTIKIDASNGTKVHFNNCSFNKGIIIVNGDKIVLENNNYNDGFNNYFFGYDCFFTADNVKEISFVNDNFCNSASFNKKSYKNSAPVFGMKVNSEKVNFINSNIDLNGKYPAVMNVNADSTEIINSNINANEVNIDSTNIYSYGSNINAKKGTIIINDGSDIDCNVQSPIVIYKQKEVSGMNNEMQNDSNIETSLKDARRKLIDNLHELSKHCQQLNNNMSQDNLNSQTIIKTLKQR